MTWEFNDFVSVFFMLAVWFQPVLWMRFYYVKTKRLDCLVPLQVISLWLLLHPNLDIFFKKHPILYTMAWYSSLGMLFSIWLQDRYKWHFPQALSVGILGSFIGSYLWEVPHLIRTASSTGLFDWMLHGFGLLLVWFISTTVGWVSLSKGLPWISLSFAISVICMLLKPTATSIMSPMESNSAIYVFNRIASTLIVFKLIKVKKNDL